jgi:phosphate transport system permease protein
MVVYHAAVQSMLPGIILAVARIAGDTAALLFRALRNQFWTTDMIAPMTNLPLVIFQVARSLYAGWQSLARGGALLITASILALNIVARIVAARRSFSI